MKLSCEQKDMSLGEFIKHVFRPDIPEIRPDADEAGKELDTLEE